MSKRTRPIADEEPPWSRLKTVGFKVRGLAYLIECKRSDDPPLDIEELFYGIAQIINQLGENIHVIACDLEDRELSTKPKGHP